MESGSLWGISKPSAQFCPAPKAARKTEVSLEGKEKTFSLEQVYTAPTHSHTAKTCSFTFFREKRKKGASDLHTLETLRFSFSVQSVELLCQNNLHNNS